MTPVGFEPAFPASERQQNYALDGAAIVIGKAYVLELTKPRYTIETTRPLHDHSLHVHKEKFHIFRYK
jgi:hypothetical protein